MHKIDLKSLGVSQDEVEAVLARERRPGVHRRLVAVGVILEGKSIKQAARAAKATRRSVERWLGQVRRSGFHSLLADERHGHAKRRMKPSEVEQTRRQIAAALARPLKPQVRARLIAADTVLSGRSIDEAAGSAHVLPDAVRRWLRVISRDGVATAVAGWQIDRRLRPGKLDVDPATLHELAANEINSRVRKRIHALACMAEGMSTYDAEVKTGLNHWAITKRLRRFREEGVAAFQDRKIAGRPRKLDAGSGAARTRPAHRKVLRQNLNVREPPAATSGVKNARGRPRKLSAAQLEELCDYVLKRPDTSFWRLHRLVWNRFHVRHSHASLKRLLKNEFGIVWTGSSKKLGAGLNLAELQDALADSTDWRMKKRLKALIQLAKGGEAEAVARSHRVHLETLRKWTKRFTGLGIGGLRATHADGPLRRGGE